MRFEQDTGGFDKVVEVATKYANTADKVVGLIAKADNVGRNVGKIRTSTKVGLLVGGALALCLFPLRLAYDSQTGEGEYRSLLVSVKRTQRPARPTKEGNERDAHSISWEMFPTVRVRPSDVKPCDLPPAQKREPRKAIPMQVHRVQKAKVAVPVKLCAQEEKA